MADKLKEETLAALTKEFESINALKSRVPHSSYYNLNPILKELMSEGKVESVDYGKQIKFRRIG